MEAQKKIKEVRQNLKLSRQELYQRLKDIFGDRAIKPNSIWRIESGLTSARLSSLHQICVALGISLKALLGETAEGSRLVNLIRKNQRVDRYAYNQKAVADILTPHNSKFLAGELNLLPGAATRSEADPIEVGKFEKWVYCLSGKLDCTVGTETHSLSKGDCLSFESNLPHHFENNSSKKTKAIVVQNPRYI